MVMEIGFSAKNCISLLHKEKTGKGNGYEDDSGIYATVERV